jgi:hypothetical protein
MRRWLLPCLFVLVVAACSSDGPDHIAQFWRPISEPNLNMALDKGQKKLDFDLSQCHCGIYPANATRDDTIEFQPDRQRLAETGVTVTPNENGQCMEQPSLIVTECMRQRGWEQTNCSGRMPLAGGGSLCTAYAFPDNPN